MIDPRELSDDPVEQDRIYQAELRAESLRNHCPWSGLSITRCKQTDLCDCFAFPEHEPVITVLG